MCKPGDTDRPAGVNKEAGNCVNRKDQGLTRPPSGDPLCGK